MSELMTLPELAQYLRFTRKTIYGLLKQEKIPAMKIGRKWRFDKEKIDDWLSKGAKAPECRVLVIDDEEVIRALFKKTLAGQNNDVTVAATGQEGIRLAGSNNFDIIFLDLKLPDVEGAEVLRQIKQIKPGQLVCVITGYPDSALMERALKEGPLGVMNKPFSASDIRNAVSSFCKIGQ